MDTIFSQENEDKALKESELKCVDRINKMEKTIRDKFQSKYESVRKAFLSLDQDHDGFVTVDEFWKVFGELSDINYNDLKKLVQERDRSGKGKIDY